MTEWSVFLFLFCQLKFIISEVSPYSIAVIYCGCTVEDLFYWRIENKPLKKQGGWKNLSHQCKYSYLNLLYQIKITNYSNSESCLIPILDYLCPDLQLQSTFALFCFYGCKPILVSQTIARFSLLKVALHLKISCENARHFPYIANEVHLSRNFGLPHLRMDCDFSSSLLALNISEQDFILWAWICGGI